VSEYRKILAILPEEDEKARDNIQGLIDTIEQGASNVDEGKKQDVSDGINDDESQDVTADNALEEKLSLLVISGKDSEERAQKGLALFNQEEYDLTQDIRNEDREVEDVVILYGADVDPTDADGVRDVLREGFNNVQVERNDEEVSKYNHDIIIVIGSSKKDKEDE